MFDNRPACFNDDQGFEEFTVTDNLWRAHFQHGIRRRPLPGRNRAASQQVEKSRQHDAAKQNYGYGTGVAPSTPLRSDILGLQTRRPGWPSGGRFHALLLDVHWARKGGGDARTANELG